MVCRKCLLAIDCKNDLFIVCDGSCCGSYHIACVQLSEASMQCVKKNIIWLCDACLSAFYDHVKKSFLLQPEPDKVPSKVDVELADMKEQIAYIMEAVTALSDGNKHTSQCAPKHSTPVSIPDLRVGSRAFDGHSSIDHSTAIGSDIGANGHCEKTFSLFLTNIDGRVNEDEISDMVSRSLNIEKSKVINVKKLVPKWKLCDDLAYASFRVTLDDKLKPIACREDSWPSGVKYREFIEYPRSTWKPTGWT